MKHSKNFNGSMYIFLAVFGSKIKQEKENH